MEESQPFRKKSFGLGVDEYAAAVERYVRIRSAKAENFRVFLRNEEESMERDGSICAKVHMGEGVFIRMGDELEEFIVFFRCDIGFGLAPDCLHGVEAFALELDGEVDEVRVAAQDFLHAVFLGEFGVFFLEVDDDTRSTVDAFGGSDAVAFASIALPFEAGGIGIAGVGEDFHFIRHHEGAVEAHAELTDEVGVAIRFFEGFKELFRAGVGNGAKVFDEVGFRHADTGVRNGDRLLLFIGRDGDGEGLFRLENVRVGQLLDTQFFQCVRGIGNQLANKNFTVAVEGVDNDVEKLPDFCLEWLLCCCAHEWLIGLNDAFIIVDPSRG